MRKGEGKGGEGRGEYRAKGSGGERRGGEVEENKAYERERVQEGRRGGGRKMGWKGRYGMLHILERYCYN